MLKTFPNTKWISIRRRESMLMAMDALGKWNMIDSYFMILMFVAFRFHIVLPPNIGIAFDAVGLAARI